MTAHALLKLADGKRLAKIAKSEGVAVQFKMGDAEITIFPNSKITAEKEVDEVKEILL